MYERNESRILISQTQGSHILWHVQFLISGALKKVFLTSRSNLATVGEHAVLLIPRSRTVHSLF